MVTDYPAIQASPAFVDSDVDNVLTETVIMETDNSDADTSPMQEAIGKMSDGEMVNQLELIAEQL